MLELQGVGVLVTRPEHQATPLCRLLKTAGAAVFRLPAIAIRAAPDLAALKRRIGGRPSDFDLVIFTSANAVRFGTYLLEDDSGRPRAAGPPLAAIGPATARCLNDAGYTVGIMPAAGADSEHLLRHPALEAPAGRRILLVKGANGRPLLQEELTRHGALVIQAEVYQRERAHPPPGDLSTLTAQFREDKIQIITATSLEIGTALLALATPQLLERFQLAHWLIPGARVAEGLRARGVVAPFILADTAADHDLLAAIARWRSIESGA